MLKNEDKLLNRAIKIKELGESVLKDRMGPFPEVSRVFWSLLLALQEQKGLNGDLAEIGVQRGSTALSLISSAMAYGGFVHLFDITEDETFKALIEDQYPEWSCYYKLNIINSTKMDPQSFPNHCRWIHIDGGHLYHHVENDLRLINGKLADRGVLVIDDFFEARWPDVTLATISWLKETKGMQPFALVERKLYLCRPTDQIFYKSAMNKIIFYMRKFGYKCWEDQIFNNNVIDIIKV